MAGSYEHGDESSGSTESGDFFFLLVEGILLLKKGSATCSYFC